MTFGQMLIIGGVLFVVVFLTSSIKTYKEEKAKRRASAKYKKIPVEEKEDEE